MTDANEHSQTGQWVRSAFWVGTPHDTTTFRAAIVDSLIPRLAALPGVAGAESLWPARREDEPPAIHCQIIVRYASFDDLERMLASPERAAMRDDVRALARTFDGTISHIDYQVA